MQRGAVVTGDKVLLIDDLLATGGTLCSGIELVKSMGATTIECGCLVELQALKGRERCMAAGATDVWGLLTEDLLTVAAELPDDYVDDGAPH
jgi:adenine phosphoribosyltransferase